MNEKNTSHISVLSLCYGRRNRKMTQRILSEKSDSFPSTSVDDLIKKGGGVLRTIEFSLQTISRLNPLNFIWAKKKIQALTKIDPITRFHFKNRNEINPIKLLSVAESIEFSFRKKVVAFSTWKVDRVRSNRRQAGRYSILDSFRYKIIEMKSTQPSSIETFWTTNCGRINGIFFLKKWSPSQLEKSIDFDQIGGKQVVIRSLTRFNTK